MNSGLKNYIIDFTTLDLEERGKYAEPFSEGDENLKNLLLKLWSNKIKTYGCCAGHENIITRGNTDIIEKINGAYIAFEISTLTEKQLRKLYEILILYTRLYPDMFFSVASDFDLFGPNFYRNMLSLGGPLAFDAKFLLAIVDYVIDNNRDNMLLEVQEFLAKCGYDKELTEEEKKFIDVLIEFSEINFKEYFEKAKNLGNEKIVRIDIELKKSIECANIQILRGQYFDKTVKDGVVYYDEKDESDQLEYQKEKFSRELFETLRDEIEDVLELNNSNTL